MLKSEYECITGTSIWADIYDDLIEPIYMESPPWLTKYDFCALINAKALSEFPAVPYNFYYIDNCCYTCKKVDIIAQIVTFESYVYKKTYTLSFKEAMTLRKQNRMRRA